MKALPLALYLREMGGNVTPHSVSKRNRIGWAVVCCAAVLGGLLPAVQAQRNTPQTSRPSQDNQLAAVVLEDRVRLRWELPAQFPAGGYRIYRNDTLLTETPVRPIGPNQKLEGLNEASAKLVAAFLQFMKDPNQAPADVREQLSADVPFVLLLHSADNIAIARALGILFDDVSAVRGSAYTYRLAALDADGRETPLGTQVVRVQPAAPPAGPTGLTLAVTPEATVAVRWKYVKPAGPADASIFRIYRSTSPGASFERVSRDPVLVLGGQREVPLTAAQAPFFEDRKAEDGQTYFYRVTGVDFFGRESAPSELQSIEFLDPRPPLAVHDLAAKAAPTTVTLSWTVPPASRIAKLRVTRSESVEGPFEPVGDDLPATALTFTDTTPFTGRQYFYRVASLNRRGAPADFFPVVLASAWNPSPPAMPRNLKAEAKPGEVTLTWQPNSEPDLAGYRVYRAVEEGGDFALVSDTVLSGTQYTDSFSPSEGGRRWYRVAAVNTSNLESEKSAPAFIDAVSIAPPAPPVLATGPLTEGRILLEWQAGDENASGYNVYRTFVPTTEMIRLNEKPLPASQTRYEDSEVDSDVTYYYAVEAVDKQGLTSPRSNIVSATTFSTAAAPVPTNLRAEVNVPSQPPGVTLTWKIPEGQRLRCAVYRGESPEGPFRRASAFLFEDQLQFTDPAITPGRTYYYVVRARTPAGQVSPNSAVLKVTAPPRSGSRR